eukprot:6203621-Pleurochrysis_carterae.AAC.1
MPSATQACWGTVAHNDAFTDDGVLALQWRRRSRVTSAAEKGYESRSSNLDTFNRSEPEGLSFTLRDTDADVAFDSTGEQQQNKHRPSPTSVAEAFEKQATPKLSQNTGDGRLLLRTSGRSIALLSYAACGAR